MFIYYKIYKASPYDNIFYSKSKSNKKLIFQYKPK